MLKDSACRLDGLSLKRLIDSGMADRTVVSDHLTFLAEMLSIMTSKTPLGVVVPDVVYMSLPVSLHLREEVGLVNSLQFRDRTTD